MTRIVAGAARGRRLLTPAGRTTRPTGERVREALASALEPVAGLTVVDLCAGSGAVGLELLSRGAASVTLVETDPAALVAIRANVATVGLPGAVVAARPALQWLAEGGDADLDVAYVDPPYADEVDDLLAALAPRLRPDAVVVVERDRRAPEPTWPAGVCRWRSRDYGDTRLWWGLADAAR